MAEDEAFSNRFTVPQFIDVESKIIGPITVRQFIIILADFGIVFLFYKLFDFALFAILGLPTLAMGFIIAFVKINGQAFHYFILNVLQTLKRPNLKIWDKNLTTAELQAILKAPEVKIIPPTPTKSAPQQSRLTELSLVVNTGGVYEPDEW